MSDWGKGASSKKRNAPPELKYRYKDLICSKCGRFWMFRFLYDSDLKQTQDEYGRTLCQNCRTKVIEHKPSPPPPNVQMTIDEIMRAKK